MRIATWNVNSIRQRLEPLLAWLKECSPDIVCLQEIKCVDEAFPRLEIEALGYNVVTHGQKTFNGVALLSKLPFDETKSGLAGDDEDAHARFLEGVVTLKRGVVRIACLYLPNGNPADSDKYPYKLKWMSRASGVCASAAQSGRATGAGWRLQCHSSSQDVYNPAAWVNDALFRTATRESFQSLLGLGLTDALRAVSDTPGQYTFWITRPAPGRRTGPAHRSFAAVAAGQRPARGCRDRQLCRAWEKPSDHVPVWADLDLETA